MDLAIFGLICLQELIRENNCLRSLLQFVLPRSVKECSEEEVTCFRFVFITSLTHNKRRTRNYANAAGQQDIKMKF